MEGRGPVLTTTNKARLDETVGKDSAAFEVVGKPHDLDQIKLAIHAARSGPKVTLLSRRGIGSVESVKKAGIGANEFGNVTEAPAASVKFVRC